MRHTLTLLAVAGLLLTGATPAAPPDFPVNFISVDELKALLDQKTRIEIIDVRTQAEYDAVHIKGARVIPLRTMRERAAAIVRTGPVVLY